MTLKLGMHHRVLEYYQICSNDDPGLTLTYFMARSNLVPCAFIWEKGKTIDFSEIIVVCDLKVTTDDWSDRKFLSTSNLCPLGAVCHLTWGYKHVLNHEKKMFKIRLKRDSFETCNKWIKLTSKFCPGGRLPLLRGYIHVFNHEKNCIKSDFKEIFF